MQTTTLSSNATNSRLPESNLPPRLRAFRLLSKRFAQRERPSVVAEFSLFAVIVLTSTWPLLSLVHTMGLRH